MYKSDWTVDLNIDTFKLAQDEVEWAIKSLQKYIEEEKNELSS